MRLLPDKLKDTASRWPDKTAIRDGEKQLSFAELARSASSVGAWLASVGVKPGDKVALLTHACGEYVIAYYGALISGAAVVALNAAAKGDDLLAWIAHSESSALVIDAEHPESAKILGLVDPALPVLAIGKIGSGSNLDDFASIAGSGATVPADRAASPTDLAALIYTSGTTGRPKGVMLDHGNLAANTDSIVEYLGLSDSDGIVNVLPFYYSFGNSVLHTHIAAGATLTIQKTFVYPHQVVDALAREKATGFAGVPSTFALLTGRVDLSKYDLSSLRYFAQAGGPMSPAMVNRVRSLLPNVDVYVMYGLTEASARVSYLPPERLDDKLGSIGIPIPGVDMQVRGKDGEVLPAGENGEIWVRGRNVMAGYWKDPDMTSQVLSDGWLRTGDIGRCDDDGFFFVEGRRSDIIKVGAHRISPLELESVVEELEGVGEVAVVGVDDDFLGQVIKAYVVRNPGSSLSENEIKAHCRNRLATYKIPKYVEFIDALPKTSSGKVQRTLLGKN